MLPSCHQPHAAGFRQHLTSEQCTHGARLQDHCLLPSPAPAATSLGTVTHVPCATDQLWLGLCLVGSHSSTEHWDASSPARCQERRALAGWEQRGTAPCPSGWGQAPCAVLQHPRLWHRPRISPPFIPAPWWLRAASRLQAVGVPATKCGLPARGTCCRQVSKQQLYVERPALVLQVIQQAQGHRLLPAQPCPSSLQPCAGWGPGAQQRGGSWVISNQGL